MNEDRVNQKFRSRDSDEPSNATNTPRRPRSPAAARGLHGSIDATVTHCKATIAFIMAILRNGTERFASALFHLNKPLKQHADPLVDARVTRRRRKLKRRFAAFSLSLLTATLGGVIATNVTFWQLSRQESQQNAEIYHTLRGSLRIECERFSEALKSFAGHGDGRGRGNIHRIPDFSFSLLDAIEDNKSVFLDIEGPAFLQVMANFSRMRAGYDGIQAEKTGRFADGKLSWNTTTFMAYYRPAVEICKWVGVDILEVDYRPYGWQPPEGSDRRRAP
jgi:hypothetical protein